MKGHDSPAEGSCHGAKNDRGVLTGHSGCERPGQGTQVPWEKNRRRTSLLLADAPKMFLRADEQRATAGRPFSWASTAMTVFATTSRLRSLSSWPSRWLPCCSSSGSYGKIVAEICRWLSPVRGALGDFASRLGQLWAIRIVQHPTIPLTNPGRMLDEPWMNSRSGRGDVASVTRRLRSGSRSDAYGCFVVGDIGMQILIHLEEHQATSVESASTRSRVKLAA